MENKKTILLIEDEEALRKLYREILLNEGFDVDEASDGEKGLKLLKEGGYDLILLDLILPKIDGLEILRRLQVEKPRVPNGPILVLTNVDIETVVSEGLNLGIRGYLVKSDVTPDQIIKEVKAILGEL